MSPETSHTVRQQRRIYQFLPDLQHQGGLSRLIGQLARRGGIPGTVSCMSRAWPTAGDARHLPHPLRGRSSSFWRCSFAFWRASWAVSDLRLGISYSSRQTRYGGDRPHYRAHLK